MSALTTVLQHLQCSVECPAVKVCSLEAAGETTEPGGVLGLCKCVLLCYSVYVMAKSPNKTFLKQVSGLSN